MAPARAVVALLALVLLYACDTGLPVSTPSNVANTTPSSQNAPGTKVVGQSTESNPTGAIPENAPKPAPQASSYNGCPANGDGGDRQLNNRKNRTDSAAWYPVSIGSILALSWPFVIGGQPRVLWSADSAAQIARYEGIPVQVEGWLAGAKKQGPESCNCHASDDVDNHLWIVDSPGKDRSQSVVAEITPRVRASHPGWTFSRVQPLVDGHTKVRISGWLLMDQEHPDQIGKTRGTIWEIHPIIALDVQRNGSWVPLDQGDASSSSGAGAPPTEDPTLPSPIVDPFGGATVPTPLPQPTAPRSGGTSTGSGVVISDIFYNGNINPAEPDEYVEITNKGSQPANLEGWQLRDVYGGQAFTWHDFTLNPGQKIRVYTNQVHPDSGGFSFGSNQALWSNKGDAAELLDASGTVVSTFGYGDRK